MPCPVQEPEEERLAEDDKHFRTQANDDYMVQKRISQLQGYDELTGVNSMVYEENHNYLRDLQTQQKRKFYPTMAETSPEFGNLLFPASQYAIGQSRLKQLEALDYQRGAAKDNNSTPFHGNWTSGGKNPD
mmetsp:Transcript_18688/g.28618  ORF Transcript_18688/g.28618 Transcript_18688/m.28618 type:complete len:131 (+) Transcript_18688:1177-1569(+)